MNLSVIIPTINEEKYLKNTITHLRENSFTQPFEILVVDSGSTDQTTWIAESKEVVLLHFQPKIKGRGSPLNYGADRAKGETLLFLDADTKVPKYYDLHINKALEDEKNIGGAFEFALDGNKLGFRIVELINRIRYRLRKRYYGDQGLFVRKEIFDKVGGFPETQLLESAYLCAKLQKEGNLVLIKREIKTSPRRFRKGIIKPFGFDIKIWFLNLIGFDVNKYSEKYW